MRLASEAVDGPVDLTLHCNRLLSSGRPAEEEKADMAESRDEIINVCSMYVALFRPCFPPLRRSFSEFSARFGDEKGRRRILIKFRFGSRVERL